MSFGTIFLLILAGLILFYKLIPFVVMLFQALNHTIWPSKLTAVAPPLEVSPDQQAAVAELEALGFRQVAAGQLETGPLRYGVMQFRHHSKPAFAFLSFTMDGVTAYPVVFFSTTNDGRQLVTCNRVSWTLLVPEAALGYALLDAYAETLAAHWQCHQARLAWQPALALEDQAAWQVLVALIENKFDNLLAAGVLVEGRVGWHPRLKAALRIVMAWFRVRQRLKGLYRSAVTEGEHQSAFFAFCYEHHQAKKEQASRATVRLWLFGLTMLASVLAFGLLTSWNIALAVTVVTLVHEGGHFVAMRAFGYRDLTVFFLPLMGALITGKSRELKTWQQAIVLLAGPVPGLILGLCGLVFLQNWSPAEAGFDWRVLAASAVFINLFNLLPLTPLDGGQLLEICLFSRWPWARLAFVIVSLLGFVGLALKLSSPFLWLAVLYMVLASVRQWRITRLQSAIDRPQAAQDQIRHLFELTRKLFKLNSFMAHYRLVETLVIQSKFKKPTRLETMGAVTVLACLWLGSGTVLTRPEIFAASWLSGTDQRTAAQHQFDSALSDFRQRGCAVENVASLAHLAEGLSLDDPRRVDLAVLAAFQQLGAARREALEQILAAGRGGNDYSLSNVVGYILRAVYDDAETATLARQAELVQQALDRVTALAPAVAAQEVEAATVEARLWLIGVVDQGEDSDRALVQLRRLRYRLASVQGPDGYERRMVEQALVWYHLAHGRPGQALADMTAWRKANRSVSPGVSFQLDYAWVLLALGRTGEGLEQMTKAAVVPAYQPSLLEWLLGWHSRPEKVRYPLVLAYALVQGGRQAEAVALMAKLHRVCDDALRDEQAPLWSTPWLQSRDQRLQATARAVCPAPASAP